MSLMVQNFEVTTEIHTLMKNLLNRIFLALPHWSRLFKSKIAFTEEEVIKGYFLYLCGSFFKQIHMKSSIISLAMLLLTVACLTTACTKATATGTQTVEPAPKEDTPVVYVTRDLSPEALVRIYEAVGRSATGRIALKISTGESSETGYIRPEMMKPLIDHMNSTEGNKVTIVECNTAYPGNRNTTKKHLKAIRERGFEAVAPVDIMDAEGQMRIPVCDTTWIKYDLVGNHLKNYDFMVNLAHFKGHQMAGMGGVLKNASIGVASAAGKAYIHSAGVTEHTKLFWLHTKNQDGFVESMAAAAQAVHNYFDNGQKVLYICVMYRMSIDCDCNAHPEKPLIADYGILASTDPVALDQACYDIVTKIHNDAHNNNQPLLDRIEEKHGTHIMEWGEHIGLGSRNYVLKSID